MFALVSGNGHGLAASILRGFGWGIGREVAHDLVRQVLR
ncbi:hypothetical protein MPC1_9700001 [Methylocella tundrae]|nr:hypothetical protein MPC1_9700001 [Methylocella tundrae]